MILEVALISLKEEGEKFLVKTDEAEYNCDAIIIATGTEPRKLDEERTKEVGDRPILYCATCDGALYKDKTAWDKASLMNIAGAGIFASDRSIRDYALNIWHIK